MTQNSMQNKGESLRSYQERLQSLLESARQNSQADLEGVYVGFEAGGRYFLVSGRDLLDVHRPTPLEPIPAAKPWAVGAANIKGTVYAVTDFSIFNGTQPIRGGKYLIVRPEIMVCCALLVDSITGLFSEKDLGLISKKTGVGSEEIVGHCLHQEKNYQVLDLNLLSINQRFSILQRGESQ